MSIFEKVSILIFRFFFMSIALLGYMGISMSAVYIFFPTSVIPTGQNSGEQFASAIIFSVVGSIGFIFSTKLGSVIAKGL